MPTYSMINNAKSGYLHRKHEFGDGLFAHSVNDVVLYVANEIILMTGQWIEQE